LLLLAACGDDSPTAMPDANAPQPDAAVDAFAVRKEGQVVIMEGRSPDPSATAVASFVDGRLLVPIATADGCDVFDNTPASSLDAGSITITGTSTPLTLVQEAAGKVYTTTQSVPDDLFSPAATLTVTATGGTVPAFTGGVTAPAPLDSLVIPSSISRATPATITWTAGSGNEVWVLVAALNGAARGMLCRTTDSGSFTLTEAAIAQLPATTTEVSLLVYRVKKTVVTAGSWDVMLYAVDNVTNVVPLGT
jgi:hypothetical protein